MNCIVRRLGSSVVTIITIMTTLPRYFAMWIVLPSEVLIATSAHGRGVCCAKHAAHRQTEAANCRKLATSLPLAGRPGFLLRTLFLGGLAQKPVGNLTEIFFR